MIQFLEVRADNTVIERSLLCQSSPSPLANIADQTLEGKAMFSVTRRMNLLIQLGSSICAILLCTTMAQAQAKLQSQASGNWTSAATWTVISGSSGTGVPTAVDTVVIAAGHTVTMDGNPGSAYSLTIDGTADWGAARTTNIGAGGIVIDLGGNITGTLAGILTSTGSAVIRSVLTSTGVTIRFQTNSVTLSGGGSIEKLDITSTVTNLDSITVRSALTGAGKFTAGSNSMLKFRGSSIGISQHDLTTNVNTLVLDATTNQTIPTWGIWSTVLGGGGTKTIGGANSFYYGDITVKDSASLFNTGSAKNYRFYGDWTITTTGTVNLSQFSNSWYLRTPTVNPRATSISGTYSSTIPFSGTLSIENTYGQSIGLNISVSTSLNLSAGVTLTPASGNTISGAGTATINGVAKVTRDAASTDGYSTQYTIANSTLTNGTVEYASTSTQTVSALNYGNLTSSSSGARILPSSGTIGIAKVFTPGNNSYTVSGSTVNFNGTASQTIPAFSYGNLASSSTGARVLALTGTIGVAGTFAPGSNAYTVAGSTVSFNGSTKQTIPAFSYESLKIDNSAGASLAGNIAVPGALTLNSGIIFTGADTLSIISTGNVSRLSGHIAGNLRKQLSTGSPSQTFEIGDSSIYSPLTVSFSGITSDGALTAGTTAGDHPNLASSTIDLAKSVNRYWTLTNGGIVFTDVNATFNFNASDIDVGANTSRFRVGKYAGGIWAYPVTGVRTATSTEATVLNGFGDFGVGEGINVKPALTVPGAQVVNEGQVLTFRVSAVDPEGTTPTLTALNVPTNATFADSTNGAGGFTFTPDFTQAGPYTVSFIASDGSLADTQTMAITVTNVNRKPVLTAIGAQTIAENQTLDLHIESSDPDGTIPTLTALSLPSNGTFTDSTNGAGGFTFTPDFTQAGPYTVSFIASDGSLADTQTVAITVNNVDRKPVLVVPGSQVVNEGQLLSVHVTATDPDATIPSLSALNLPSNGTFTDSTNGAGGVTFTPDYTQAGLYTVSFIASDGSQADTQTVTITVINVNRKPVLTAIGAQTLAENQTLDLHIQSNDPDGTTPTLSVLNVPTNGTFIDSANGAGGFTFTPDYTQAGPYTVSFIASDGSLADTQTVAITVTNVNRRPALTVPGALVVNEGQVLTFRVSAVDPEGTTPTLSALNMPTNGTFADSTNGAGGFTFTPDFTQAGPYTVSFIASDGSLADTQTVAITVTNVNRRPVLTAISPQSVNQGQILSVHVTATDPDGSLPSLTAPDLPLNATMTDSLNGAGSFHFTPDFTQLGPYSVSIVASDGSLADTQVVVVTVVKTNRKPALAAIAPQTVSEGQLLNVHVTATDPDATIPSLSALNMPTNATFADSTTGGGLMIFSPNFSQAGPYTVSFIASDGSLGDTQTVAITVTNVNRRPVLTAIGAQTLYVGDTLALNVIGTDADGDSLIMTALNLPANASFSDHWNGSGSLSFHPDITQTGIHIVTFIASDGALTDSEVVAITVNHHDSVTIAGNAGAAGTTLSYVTDTTKATTADSSGIYSLRVPYDWSGTVTPTKAGYGFTPTTRTYASVIIDQIDQDFQASIISDVGGDNGSSIPKIFRLVQNYPNPFNPTTTIEYNLPHRSRVTVEIFNLLGQAVRTLVDEEKAAGNYRLGWDGTDTYGRTVSSGIYLYRIIAGDFTQCKKMVLLK
jgi:hypothetical protein